MLPLHIQSPHTVPESQDYGDLLTALTIAIFCPQFPRPRRIETNHTKTTCGHHSEILGELRTYLIWNAFWPHVTLLSDDKLTSPLLETTHPTL